MGAYELLLVNNYNIPQINKHIYDVYPQRCTGGSIPLPHRQALRRRRPKQGE